MYENISGYQQYLAGELIGVGATVTVDYYIYDSRWSLDSGDIDIVYYSNSLSGLDTATFTYDFISEDTYVIYINPEVSCSLYFNLNSTPMLLNSKFEMDIDTRYVNSISLASSTVSTVSLDIYRKRW